MHDSSSSETEHELRLEGVGQGSNPWGDVPEGIMLVLVLFAQDVVGIARER